MPVFHRQFIKVVKDNFTQSIRFFFQPCPCTFKQMYSLLSITFLSLILSYSVNHWPNALLIPPANYTAVANSPYRYRPTQPDGFSKSISEPIYHVHYYHIQKTGGTTLVLSLPRILGLKTCKAPACCASVGRFHSYLLVEMRRGRGCSFSHFEGRYPVSYASHM